MAHVAGWSVLPSAGWRRVVAAPFSTLAMWLLLTGPRFVGVLVISYLAWLLVRHRPILSYSTVAFVFATSVVIGRVFTDYRDMLIALAVGLASIFVSAFAARAIHRAIARPRQDRPASDPSPANPQRPGPEVS
jgi:hypothetical protein